jgi:hypothetical protein
MQPVSSNGLWILSWAFPCQNSYEATVEPISPNGIVWTAAHTHYTFSKSVKYAILMGDCSAPVVTTGTRSEVEQKLKCWQTLCNKLCHDITIRLVTTTFQICIPYSVFFSPIESRYQLVTSVSYSRDIGLESRQSSWNCLTSSSYIQANTGTVP